MRILLDTNVLLDYVWKRNNNNTAAIKLLTDCTNGKYQGYVTSHSLCDFFYITRKDFSVTQRRELLLLFISIFSVLVESADDFKTALNKEYFFDIEDGLQIQSAESAELDYIITENIKDFTHTKVKVISVNDFVQSNS